MRAVIMAGGMGSRLLPITSRIPKPMVPVLGLPAMEYAINNLKKCNITKIDVTLRYLPSVITDYFGDGYKWGVKIKWLIEKEPLGTAGGVFDALKKGREDILILSGDAATDIDLQAMIDFHQSNKSMVTMAVKKVDSPTEFGVVVSEKNEIKRFIEKPNWSAVCSDTVNTGIYILDKSMIKYDTGDRPIDFSKNVFPSMLKDGVTLMTYDMDDQYWCDIGSPSDFLKANIHYLQKKCYISKSIKMGNNSRVIMPCHISDKCEIGDGVIIGPNVYVGEGCKIGKECRVTSSVIMHGCRLKYGSQVDGAVICDNTMLNENSIIETGAIIGNNSVIEENAIVHRNVKIWPDSKIPPYSVINEDIKDSNFKQSIESVRMGRIVAKVSLSECCQLGGIIANLSDSKYPVALCAHKEDPSAIAMRSGILQAGRNCMLVNMVPGYLFRNLVKHKKCKYGIFVNHSGEELKITILNAQGESIDAITARKIKDAIKRNQEMPSFVELTAKTQSAKVSLDDYENRIRKVMEKFKIRYGDLFIFIDKDSKQLYDCGLDQFKGVFYPYSSKLAKEKGATLSVVLKNNGMEHYYVGSNGQRITAAKVNALQSKSLVHEIDPIIRALDLINNGSKAEEKPSVATVNKIFRCPQNKKGTVMKELYKRYGQSIKASENGIRLKYGKADLRISPHEYAPVINVVGVSNNKRTASTETTQFINEIEKNILGN